jgi:hypothetical protein
MSGLLIATGGIELCFLLNALSFGAMIVALRSLDTSQLAPPKLATRERGAVRSALRYVTRTPELAIPLGMMALVGTLGFNFQVLLPLLARETFAGDATAYSLLAVAMGAGAIAGALVTSARRRIGEGLLVGAALAFGVFGILAALAPTLQLEALALAPLGAASVTFAAGINSTLQLAAEPHMRGRVMALYSIVFLGSTPIGGPIAGWLAGAASPRAALLMGGVAGIVVAAWAFAALRRTPAPARTGAPAPEPVDPFEPLEPETGELLVAARSAATPAGPVVTPGVRGEDADECPRSARARPDRERRTSTPHPPRPPAPRRARAGDPGSRSASRDRSRRAAGRP